MNDWSEQQHCKDNCLPNCEEISYDYTRDTSVLDPDQLCEEGTDTRKVWFTFYFIYIFQSEHIFSTQMALDLYNRSYSLFTFLSAAFEVSLSQ